MASIPSMRGGAGRILLGMLGALLLLAGRAQGRASGDPIRMEWQEGDVAGTTAIYGPDDRVIGMVEYHQVRRGERLSSTRIARFTDGSRDEDEAEALVGERLVGLRGRTVIRDPDGQTTVDLTIDVRGGRISGTVGRGADRRSVDLKEELPPGTYWGPLVFIALKNFAANAEDGRLAFRTVVPTPEPRVFDLAFTASGPAPVARAGITLKTQRFLLAPSVHRFVDPLIRKFVPEAAFFVLPGDPPALARFAGPRNFDRQPISIQ